MNRFACFSITVSLLIAAAPCLLGGGEADRKTAAIQAETPQALLAVYDRALAQKDWRTCFLCYDPKMRGQFLLGMFFAQGITNDIQLTAIIKKWLQIDFSQVDATFPKIPKDDRVPDELLWYEALRKRTDDLPGFVDQFCRRLNAMEQESYPSFGEVKEIKIERDNAVGYWTPPPIVPIAPALAIGGGTPDKANQSAAPPRAPPASQGAAAVVPGLNDRPEAERREPVHFRKIDGNWLFTYPDPPPPLTSAERAKQLRAEVQSLWVTLTCSQPATVIPEERNGTTTWRVVTGKSYCEVRLSVRPFVYKSNKPDLRLVRLSEPQAKRLIDHLEAEGYLRQAVELGKQKIPKRDLSKNCYALQVSTGNLQLHEDRGWGPGMVERLEGFRKALDGDGAKALDALLASLEEDRKQWANEAANPPKQQPPQSKP